MRRGRTLRRALAVVITVGVGCAPAAAAEPPMNQLCRDDTWRDAHPSACDQYNRGSPPGALPGGGGPGSGGLLGVLHRLTGGLL